jgi:hypothetical protein
MRSPLAAVSALLVLSLSACASQTPPPAAPCREPEPAGGELDRLSDEQMARKMLELTGAAALGKQIMDSMSDSLAKTSGLPPGFMDRFKANARPEELVELIVPIYLKNFDRKTMISAIRYYQSPGGQALLAKLPTATKESIEAGREWGQELAKKTLDELMKGAAKTGAPSR